MKRKYFVVVLFLAVVLATNVIIFTAPARGEDDCNIDCIDYYISYNPTEATQLSGSNPEFPCIITSVNTNEISVWDNDVGLWIYHLQGTIPEKIQYGDYTQPGTYRGGLESFEDAPPLELNHEYEIGIYTAFGEVIVFGVTITGTKPCGTTTTTTITTTTTTDNNCSTSCPDDEICCGDKCCHASAICCGGKCCSLLFNVCCGDSCCSREEYVCCNSGIGCCAKDLCPSEFIYGENSEEVEQLRAFRDDVLRQSPVGREIIELYYQWSPAIAKAMEADAEFKEEIKEMIDRVLPLIRETVE